MGESKTGPVIIILCHSRHRHLTRTLEALTSARGLATHRVVVVVDGNWPLTIAAVEKAITPDALIVMNHSESSLPRYRILKNLQVGLSTAFDSFGASYSIVLEDDVVVCDDFLDFIGAAHRISHRDPFYRAVNAFSDLPPSDQHAPNEYFRLNYGVGWGWAIPRRTYSKVKGLFRSEADLHWDAMVEPYMRSGFVISPLRSRVTNIGFDGSGAHSGSASDRKLGKALERSVLAPDEWSSSFTNMKRARVRATWRDDAISLDRLTLLERLAVYALGSLSLVMTKRISESEMRNLTRTTVLARKLRKKILRNVIPAFGRPETFVARFFSRK